MHINMNNREKRSREKKDTVVSEWDQKPVPLITASDHGNLLEKEEKKTMLVHNESWDRNRLKEMLDKNGIPEHYYSLWNEYNNDTITLVDNSNVFWEIVYMDEKGHKSLLKICPTEDEACKCLYDYFVNNKSWLDM